MELVNERWRVVSSIEFECKWPDATTQKCGLGTAKKKFGLQQGWGPNH